MSAGDFYDLAREHSGLFAREEQYGFGDVFGLNQFSHGD